MQFHGFVFVCGGILDVSTLFINGWFYCFLALPLSSYSFGGFAGSDGFPDI